MAWEAEAEHPSEQYNTYHPHESFPGEDEQLAELEAQVVAEVRARFEVEGGGDSRSPWFNPFGKAGKQSGWRWPMISKPHRVRLVEPADWIADVEIGINDRVVDLIERIEPGVHQYLPMDLYNPDGTFRERRWLLNICTRIDTIVPEKSEVVLGKSGHYLTNTGAQLTISKAKAEGRAIWCEYRVSPSRLISDTFWDGFRGANLRGWTVDPRRYIDEV